MTGYELTRNWYNYKFENVGKVKSIHSDLYFYIIDLWNRLGQKENFGLPTSITMELMGIGSYNTYKKALQDLINFGFIKVVQESANQYQSKIIALSNYDKATDKSLDKAHNKATDKSLDESCDKPTDTIIEQRNKETNEPLNNETIIIIENEFSQTQKPKSFKQWSLEDFKKEMTKFKPNYTTEILMQFYDYWRELTPSGKMRLQLEKSWQTDLRIEKWFKNSHNFASKNQMPNPKEQMKGAFETAAIRTLEKIKNGQL